MPSLNRILQVRQPQKALKQRQTQAEPCSKMLNGSDIRGLQNGSPEQWQRKGRDHAEALATLCRPQNLGTNWKGEEKVSKMTLRFGGIRAGFIIWYLDVEVAVGGVEGLLVMC